MMKFCFDSMQQREVIATMKQANVRPNVVTYCTLIGSLRMEGNEVDAQHVMNVEMIEEGIELTEDFKAIWDLDEESLKEKLATMRASNKLRRTIEEAWCKR